MNDVAVEAIAQVEERQVDDAADERFLKELENALEEDAGTDKADNEGQRQEAVVGQPAVNVLAANLQIPLPAPSRF